MRESIGTAFMLNFIILFLFLVIAFLAGTFSYYKAYRVNNYIVNAIEKFEGYNEYSRAEIAKGLSSIAYDINYTNTPADKCPDVWANSSQGWYRGSVSGGSVTVNHAQYYTEEIYGGRALPDGSYYDVRSGSYVTAPSGTTQPAWDDEGYCIYLYDNDDNFLAHSGTGPATSDIYYHYGVLTFMTLRFPVVEYFLRIPVFSRTNRMYKFD